MLNSNLLLAWNLNSVREVVMMKRINHTAKLLLLMHLFSKYLQN